MSRHAKTQRIIDAACQILEQRRPMGRNPPSQNRAIEVPRPAPFGGPRSADRRRGQPPIGWAR
jgi:hypothetical protein